MTKKHFKRICICGILIAQCKCIGERTIEQVAPCTHHNLGKRGNELEIKAAKKTVPKTRKKKT